MKNWTKNFFEDMKHIWREFKRDIAETNAKKSHCDDDMADIGHSASWKNFPDLDPQNPFVTSFADAQQCCPATSAVLTGTSTGAAVKSRLLPYCFPSPTSVEMVLAVSGG